MLEVKNLTKHFGGMRAVDDCSFSIRPEAITALIGPNGAGKTTVVNLITGFEQADAGIVCFSREDISALPPYERSKRGIARTFQQVRLFRNMSVRDNLALSLQDGDDCFFKQFIHPGPADDSRLNQALREVGLDMPLDRAVTALSFGQRKLLELARALLRPNHRLLLLDEPVAGVTPKLRTSIQEILEKLCLDGATILFIEHDMDFVMKTSDEVIVMDRGKVLAKGAPEEVRKNPEVLNAYLGEQI